MRKQTERAREFMLALDAHDHAALAESRTDERELAAAIDDFVRGRAQSVRTARTPRGVHRAQAMPCPPRTPSSPAVEDT